MAYPRASHTCPRASHTCKGPCAPGVASHPRWHGTHGPSDSPHVKPRSQAAVPTSKGVFIFFSLIFSYFCFLVAACKPCQGKLPRRKYLQGNSACT